MKIKTKVLISLFTFFITFLFISSVKAQNIPASSQCGGESLNTAQSLVLPPAGSQLVYARAGRASDAGLATLYYQTFTSTECQIIGSVEINQDSWKLIGRLNSDSQTLGTLTLTINTQADGFAGASAPSVMFVSSNNPPCAPEAGCRVVYEGKEFELNPKKISLGSDNLRVGVLSDISSGQLKEVIYSVDGKPAYTKDVLEDFNLNYVPDGEHKIERTIVLSSGQALRDSQAVKRGLEGGYTYFFVSVLFGQSRLLLLILGLLAVSVVFYVVIAILKYFDRRRAWKRAHIHDVNSIKKSSKVGPQNISDTEGIFDIARKLKKPAFVFLVAILIIYLGYTYLVGMFTVDGVSMYPTLQDKSKRLLLKLPATVGKINKNGYVPPRGTIVVVQKDENNLFDPSAEQTKSYVVKRVIGLPGERVVVQDGLIKVFNKDHEDGFVPDNEYMWVNNLEKDSMYRLDITLKENELFVVGDNRDESVDSRNYGPIQSNQIVGKVL